MTTMTMPQTSSLGHAPVKRGFIRQLGVDTVYSHLRPRAGRGVVLPDHHRPGARHQPADHGDRLPGTGADDADRPRARRHAPGRNRRRAGPARRRARRTAVPAWRRLVPPDADARSAIRSRGWMCWPASSTCRSRSSRSWCDRVWWAAGLGGITYGLWDWSLPHPPDNKNLNDFLGLGHSAAARIWTNEVIGRDLRADSAVRHPGRGDAAGDHRASAAVRHRRDAPPDHRAAGTEQGRGVAEATALRRLERDIHDGPQQRLVRLAMDLGRAKQQLDTDPVAAARPSTRRSGRPGRRWTSCGRCRAGIAPPILADRGLECGAGRAGGRNPVPVDLAVAPDLGTLSASVETTAYFVVAEALTNTAKHSYAQTCTVTVARNAGLLGVVVTDDGQGGAHVAKGHGLSGLSGPGPRRGWHADGHLADWRADRDPCGDSMRVIVADDAFCSGRG